MKNIILLAMMAFSSNALAQGEGQILHPKYPFMNSSQDIKLYNDEEGWYNSWFQNKSCVVKRNGLTPGTFQAPLTLTDSIITYEWNTPNDQWDIHTRADNYIYDANENIISYIVESWNGISWENIYKVTYTHDDNHNKTSVTIQTWNGTAWVNSIRDVYTYDTNNNNTSYTYQQWRDTVWAEAISSIYTFDANNNLLTHMYRLLNSNYFLITYTYDANDNQTSSLYQNWLNGAWVNNTYSVSTFDANNNKLEKLTQEWAYNAWVNYAQIRYTYDANNLLINELHQDWNFFEWKNDIQGTITYDTHHNPISQLIETWNDTTWENYYLYSIVYDINDNWEQSLSQFWNGTAWENEELYTYSYDSNNNLLSDLYQFWDSVSWITSNLSLYSYDTDNVLIGESNKEFDNSGIAVIYGDSTHYYFRTVTVVKDLAKGVGSISVHPNPTSGNFTISSAGTLGRIEIYNLSGVRIYSNKPVCGQSSVDIDLTAFEPGIYFVRAHDGLNIYSKKVLLQ